MKATATKEHIEEFDKSKTGQVKNMYLKRAKITGVLCITFGLCWIILNIYYQTNYYEYIIPTTLILFGIFFIIKSNKIKVQEVNKYIYNKNNQERK